MTNDKWIARYSLAISSMRRHPHRSPDSQDLMIRKSLAYWRARMSGSLLGISSGMPQRSLLTSLCRSNCDAFAACGLPAWSTRIQRFPVACSGARSVWSALSPRRYSFHTTQSGEDSRRSTRCGVDAPHTHSEKAVIGRSRASLSSRFRQAVTSAESSPR
jgi:hypothetical protein